MNQKRIWNPQRSQLAVVSYREEHHNASDVVVAAIFIFATKARLLSSKGNGILNVQIIA